MKKLVALLLAMMLLVPAFAMAASTDEGKVLNIYCWNEEFKTRFESFYTLPDGVTVNWMITPSADNAYQNALDEALMAQADVEADKKVDLFLVEADYAVKYVNTDYTLDVISDLGLTQEDVANMYGYTKDIMTDTSGALKGLSWQACPGGFIYRRSFAKDVLGTDDPAEVQAYLSDWDKFDAVAAQAKDKGYFMLSGYDDAYRCFSDNMTAPWVVDNTIQKDPLMVKYVEMTKTYTDNGWNNKANLWSAESGAGAGKDGKVFGYFGPAWFIDFCLAGWTLADASAPAEVGNGSWGDWGFVQGPQGFSWGGTWICAAAGTDNPTLVADVLKTMTCNKDVLVNICKTYNDFTNNIPAMEEMAASDFSSAFLGGQNYLGLMLENAQNIVRAKSTMYDQTCTEKFQAAMADYFNGVVDLDTAWSNFFTSVEEIHPELTH
ncbi:MAG: ABC transporter substrate-binding protein [Eubacteriales bacterium]|nr:ABC transporter substrate-binding protein [Eubacteriales bacterium]